MSNAGALSQEKKFKPSWIFIYKWNENFSHHRLEERRSLSPPCQNPKSFQVSWKLHIQIVNLIVHFHWANEKNPMHLLDGYIKEAEKLLSRKRKLNLNMQGKWIFWLHVWERSLVLKTDNTAKTYKELERKDENAIWHSPSRPRGKRWRLCYWGIYGSYGRDYHIHFTEGSFVWKWKALVHFFRV